MAVSEKEKALQTALAQIEKQFGKGAVMKLGTELFAERRGNPDRFPLAGHRAGNRRRSKRKNHRNLWTGKFR